MVNQCEDPKIGGAEAEWSVRNLRNRTALIDLAINLTQSTSLNRPDPADLGSWLTGSLARFGGTEPQVTGA